MKNYKRDIIEDWHPGGRVRDGHRYQDKYDSVFRKKPPRCHLPKDEDIEALMIDLSKRADKALRRMRRKVYGKT